MKQLIYITGIFGLIFWSCSYDASWPKPELDSAEHIVAFYNVENLFDTIEDFKINDSEFLPKSELDWDSEKYLTKLDRLATVIKKMGYPVLLGLSEVENRAVLEDLVAQGKLAKADYQIAHINTSDPRGIDCALLYQAEYFEVDTVYLIRAYEQRERNPGRQQLIVEGRWHSGTPTTVAINHWPSRRGGLAQSEPKRISAARNLFLGLYDRHDIEEDYILIMGDFNDEPANTSIERTLNAGPAEDAGSYKFINLSYPAFSEGKGSYNYRGNWNMLDQIIVSKPFWDCGDGLCIKPAKVYEAQSLMFRHPKYGMSPNRTAGGPNYYGGYSDHLPVYAPLKLPVGK
jgi:predicted extracellular nuclease